MIRKRRTVLCREGWYYILVLGVVVGGALMREINLLVVIAGMMFGPLLYNWREVVASIRRLEAERRLPEAICAGDLLVVDVRLKNSSRRYGGWAVVVEDQVRRENSRRASDRYVGSILFSSVPPGAERSLCYHGRITRRGKYRFGPLKVSTSFPLGLVRRTMTVERFETLTVCPRLGHLTPAWSSIHQQTLRGAQRILRQQNLLEPDFYGLREWKQGDSSRSIHWRTSARRGELLVRQSAEQREQDLLLLVDLWQPRAPSGDALRAVERAVSFAATVVAQICRHGGSQLDIGLGGSTVRWSEGSASAARLSEIMEELAVIEAHWTDRLPELVALARRKIRAGTTTLLVSTRPISAADLQRLESAADHGESQLGRVLCIDSAGDSLDKYFYLETES